MLRGYRRCRGTETVHEPMAIDAVEVIIAKRDGGELSDSQIDWVIDAYTRGDVADEQMSALAMAILLNGMNRREIARWTAAMIASRRADGLLDACPGPPPTSTPPAASATRSRCRWPRWSRRAASPYRSCPAAASATPAARSTSSSRSPAGGRRCPTTRCSRQLESVGAVICAAGDGPGAGRQEALRAARRHRHRRGDPADRLARS